MFLGGKSNLKNELNVNSALYVSYSDTCMLKVAAWNQQLSVKFHPVKGTNADGVRIYATDRTEIVQTSLTVDNTTALLTGIKEKILPALEGKLEASVSVTMGDGANKKVMTIKTDGNDVFAIIAINVSDNNTTTEENILPHKFNKKSYMTNYDPATGSGEEVVTHADFENFIKKLNDIYELDAAVPHAINYNTAMKASFKAAQQNSQQSNNFNSYSNNNTASNATETFTSMDDFSLPFN